MHTKLLWGVPLGGFRCYNRGDGPQDPLFGFLEVFRPKFDRLRVEDQNARPIQGRQFFTGLPTRSRR